MKKTGMRIVVTALVGVLSLAGCGDSENTESSGERGARRLPEVTTVQAEQAMSDAMLVSALSLFLAFSAEEGDTSVSSEDGALSLAWDESADFTSGVGTYTITMDEYAVPPDDPFGDQYNGYTLDGTVVMGSSDGATTRMTMNLDASHEDTEAFPVQLIEMELTGIQDDPEAMPTGYIRINGYDMEFEELAGAFQGE